ncbi:hypothetical protein [Leptotrichia sp. oral taxon 223]|uniref:hypothetical protein n=1 Tax=Leptotrichia sp. oral taxon 223 TaxID=712363 RepID=UPI0015BEDEA0|nr:hypothetical protein [Leptotrichia sp. oral taxon 223]NWO18891.1 hypothetical protein [Leptotrichia sp. oral taxon 223]
MERESVLKIEFKPVWDKWAWKITKQNEEILRRNEFIDKELNVESFRSPEFYTIQDKLFIRGSSKKEDEDIQFCTSEEKELIEEKVRAINEKYGIKKRWRAEKSGKQLIKYAEIHKIKIENEIRYIAKMYIEREEIEDESFSSPTFEETAKHVLKDCVISSYVDMTEMEE